MSNRLKRLALGLAITVLTLLVVTVLRRHLRKEPPSADRTAPSRNEYYVARRWLLLKAFNLAFSQVRKQLANAYGDDQAEAIVQQSRQEFETLIPELPYIGGGRNILTSILVICGWAVALYRVMRVHGHTAEDTMRALYLAFQQPLSRVPQVLLNQGGRFLNSKLWIALIKRQAALSQERRYPEDWVFTVTEGGGQNCSFRVEYTECAVCKFLTAQHAEAVLPYCGMFDYMTSKMCNAGMVLESTIGGGDEKCVASFKYGRDTPLPARTQLPLGALKGRQASSTYSPEL